MAKSYRIVGIGEFVWDLLPTGRAAGGAPVNFAFNVNCLGEEGIPVTAVGRDPLGQEALAHLRQAGLTEFGIQVSDQHPTGTVEVSVDRDGQPTFLIETDVAWDGIVWTERLQQISASCDAVCFGTLGQRSPVARATTARFVENAPDSALRIFDVNLRQDFYSAELLESNLRRADLVKLNHEELPRICALLGRPGNDDQSRASALLEYFGLRLVCVTRGEHGSLLVSSNGEIYAHPGHPAQVVDTVGAGDAFTAALTVGYLKGADLAIISEAGNRLGSHVAASSGSTPASTANVARQIRRDLDF